jgi:hypothetical protein
MADFSLESIVNFVLRRPNTQRKSASPTFGPSSASQEFISRPTYTEHIEDLLDNRINDNSEALMKRLFKHDPDVSAAVGAYLTLADTQPIIVVRDFKHQIDRAATEQMQSLVFALFEPTDYTLGFQFKSNFRTWCEEARYMILLRGAVPAELVFDKRMVPSRLALIDAASIRWEEKKPGEYKPLQEQADGKRVSLDFPSFFMSFHRRDPTGVYAYSDFVAAINTIAARQTVINDLYRIMKSTGYPRISIKVLEEVVRKAAPANVQNDPQAMKQWLTDRLTEVQGTFSTLRAEQAFVHFDSVEAAIINDKKPGASIDISAIIETLNAQNQAGLKTMATVIGRGQQGVNTASVEARIAAMNADQLNKPLQELLERAFTFLLAVNGIPGYAQVLFPPAELRPALELEPQRVMKQSRYLELLSHGLITDEHFSLEVLGQLPHAGAPTLSGTGFMQPVKVGVDEKKVSPNDDSLGRGLAPEGSESARSNGSKPNEA